MLAWSEFMRVISKLQASRKKRQRHNDNEIFAA
jgi:hypothetical protein